jgi:hypothetical protein
MRDDMTNERIVSTGAFAYSHNAVLEQGCQDLLKVHTPLKYETSGRSRRTSFAKRTSMQNSHDGFAGERQEQTVTVGDDGVKTRVVWQHCEDISEVAHRDAPTQPCVHEVFPWKRVNIVKGPDRP